MSAQISTTGLRDPRGRWFIIGFVFTFLIGGLWALATPLGASPDEPAHAVKAASVVRGDLTGTPNPNGSSRAQMTVPVFFAELGNDAACFAFRPAQTPNCARWEEHSASSGDEVFDNPASLYNPVFYALVGWPSLILPPQPSMYVMRLASVALGAVMVGLAAACTATLRSRRWAPVGIVLSCPPMAMFLLGSINPNGIEALSAIAFTVGLFTMTRRRSLLATATTLGAGVLLIEGRAVTPLWAFIAIVLVLLSCNWDQLKALFRRPSTYAVMVIIALLTAAAGAWTILTAHGDPNPPGVEPLFQNRSFPWMASYMLDLSGDFVINGIGGATGWADTVVPSLGALSLGFIVITVLLTAFTMLRGRALWVSALAVLAFVAVPIAVQASSLRTTGFIWQGRYALALFAIAVTLMALLLDESPGGKSLARSSFGQRRLTTGFGAVVAVLHISVYLQAMLRNTVGLGRSLYNLILEGPQWQPPGGAIPLLMAFVTVTIVGIVVGVRSAYRSGRPRPRVSPPGTRRASLRAEHSGNGRRAASDALNPELQKEAEDAL